jgi:hypothetical protein
MDLHFCNHYLGDGNPPTNRYCRNCPYSNVACDNLWYLVLRLAQSGNGHAVIVRGTNAVLFPNPNNSDLVGLKVNASWNLSKEDFLHFIATGHAKMGRAHQRQDPDSSPSLTRQEPYVQAILEMLGGRNIPEVIALRHFQQFRNVQQTQQVPQNIHVPQQKPKTLREEIVERLETEKSNLRSIQSPEAVFKMGIINQMIKMIYSGKSKYAVTDWLNKKSRSSGADVRPLVREAYLIISDFDF